MVEDDEADKEAGRVVQEVTKVLLDLGVLRKHIDDILETDWTAGLSQLCTGKWWQWSQIRHQVNSDVL